MPPWPSTSSMVYPATTEPALSTTPPAPSLSGQYPVLARDVLVTSLSASDTAPGAPRFAWATVAAPRYRPQRQPQPNLRRFVLADGAAAARHGRRRARARRRPCIRRAPHRLLSRQDPVLRRHLLAHISRLRRERGEGVTVGVC